MRNVSNLLAAILLLLGNSAAAEKPARKGKKPEPISDRHFRVYDAKGNPSTFDALLQRMQAADVVFLGESHDDPVAHHFQAKLLRAFHDAAAVSRGRCRRGRWPSRWRCSSATSSRSSTSILLA